MYTLPKAKIQGGATILKKYYQNLAKQETPAFYQNTLMANLFTGNRIRMKEKAKTKQK